MAGPLETSPPAQPSLVPPGSAAGTRVWPAPVRWLLVAALALGVLASIVWSPVSVDSRHLRADLRDGTVTWLEVGCSGLSLDDPPVRVGLGWFPTGGQRDVGVCWTTESGRSYVTGIDRASPGGTVQDQRVLRATAGAGLVSLADGEPWQVSTGWWATSAVGLLSILLVVLVLAGPQPRRHTRWGTFWLVLSAFGLGALWWLLREAPWSPARSRTPEPRPHEVGELACGTRGGGWTMLLLSVVLSALVWGVAALALDLLTPDPTGPLPWARLPR